MRCPKCGADWPSEHYFKSEEQCIECDKREGIARQTSESSNDKETAKPPSLIGLLRSALQVGQVLMWISAFVLLSLLVLVLCGLRFEGFTFSVPLDVTFIESGGATEGLRVIDGLGHFGISPPPLDYQVTCLFLLKYLGMVVVGLIVIRQLSRFLASVDGGSPFVRRSARAIGSIGWIVAVSSPMLNLFDWLISSYLVERVQLSGATFGTMLLINPEPIFVGLLIVVIAGIFDYGIRLQEEQDLTI